MSQKKQKEILPYGDKSFRLNSEFVNRTAIPIPNQPIVDIKLALTTRLQEVLDEREESARHYLSR